MTHYIYAIQAENGGPIKIGLASDVEARRRELQCGNPEKLVVLASALAPKGRRDEAAAHAALALSRHRAEWFADEPLTRLMVDWLCAGTDAGAAVAAVEEAQNLYLEALRARSVARYIRQCRARLRRSQNSADYRRRLHGFLREARGSLASFSRDALNLQPKRERAVIAIQRAAAA